MHKIFVYILCYITYLQIQSDSCVIQMKLTLTPNAVNSAIPGTKKHKYSKFDKQYVGQ